MKKFREWFINTFLFKKRIYIRCDENYDFIKLVIENARLYRKWVEPCVNCSIRYVYKAYVGRTGKVVVQRKEWDNNILLSIHIERFEDIKSFNMKYSNK